MPSSELVCNTSTSTNEHPEGRIALAGSDDTVHSTIDLLWIKARRSPAGRATSNGMPDGASETFEGTVVVIAASSIKAQS
jgi:hypothetical protein